MSTKLYRLDIVTPEQKLFSDNIEFAVFPGSEGEFGILVNHSPILSKLKPGVILLISNNQKKYIAIAGGFLEFHNNSASLITENAEFGEQINLNETLKEKEAIESEIVTSSQSQELKIKLQFILAKIKASQLAEKEYNSQKK
jgi:F-type H+-transporting ATPase subunit epsilon